MTAQVVSFGILVADIFVPPLEALPAVGELVVTEDFLIEPGGCSANVAIALRHLDVPVAVAGRVGDDVFGELVRRELAARGIETDGIVTTYGLGTSKTVILPVADEDRRYVHAFGANAALTASDLPETGEVLYVGGYLILPALDGRELAGRLAHARGRGTTVILDVVAPSGVQPSLEEMRPLLEQTDYFVPNHDEARAITGEDDPRRQVEVLAEAGARNVIVKLGERGVHVLADGRAFDLDAPTIEVVDPSGAGDAFAAGLTLGILQGWPIERTARFASVLGASACTALGCADGVFTREQAEAFLREQPLTMSRL